MNEVMETWLAYKKEKRQTYKTRGLSVLKKKILELSGGNADLARKIIEQSMANGWSGLFEYKGNDRQSKIPTGMVMKPTKDEDYDEYTKIWQHGTN